MSIYKTDSLKKKFVFFFLLFFFIFKNSYANQIQDFKISGNERIANETIVLFSGFKINDTIDQTSINQMIKNLYETTFFKNISIKFDSNIIYIEVIENPLVQSIVFEGLKRESIETSLREIIFLREKSSFLENKVKVDQDRILNALRSSGYFFANVKTKIKKNENNTVDIIYNIDRGKRALIKNIKFVGNKIFKDNKLRKVITSEETKFWKIISAKKNVDIQRFSLDEKLLTNFFKNNGYYNVRVNSSYAQLVEDRYFDIIFNINAGDKYFFNSLKLNLPIEYNKEDFSKLQNVLTKLENKPYSLNRIEDILYEIDLVALNNNYDFVSATYDEKIIDGNKINLNINLKDTEKFYIDKVNIVGNSITSERVIRNQLIADEGDPFNDILINKSFNNIKSLGIFKSVKPEVVSNDANKTKIINIEVEEKPTGEIFAGAGTGTSGSSLSFGISENNYLGEGVKLGSSFSISDDALTGQIFINDPNYKNTNRSFSRGAERSENDNLDKYGYKTEKTGFSFGTSYEQFKDIYFSPKLLNYYEKITTNSKASASKKKQEGDYLDLMLDYSLSLNKLNQNFNPTDGYRVTFSQELPVYSEDYTLINRFNISKYIETQNGTVFTLGFLAATANSLSNDDARITKRIFIPSRKLRGFEPGKIGPKDGTDYIGGNFGTSLNFASTLPRLFTEVQDLDLSFFVDAANVWGVDYDSALDTNQKIRSSTGIALDWFTPIGPLTLSYALPITKKSSDVTENFRFNIGTTF